MAEPRQWTGWDPDTETDEAKAALAAFHASARGPVSPHDPAMLMCLDKADVVSRYQLLHVQSEYRVRQMRDDAARREAWLRETIDHAADWWDRCVQARREGRKTIRLEGMDL